MSDFIITKPNSWYNVSREEQRIAAVMVNAALY